MLSPATHSWANTGGACTNTPPSPSLPVCTSKLLSKKKATWSITSPLNTGVILSVTGVVTGGTTVRSM